MRAVDAHGKIAARRPAPAAVPKKVAEVAERLSIFRIFFSIQIRLPQPNKTIAAVATMSSPIPPFIHAADLPDDM